jgi:hypothetical protein
MVDIASTHSMLTLNVATIGYFDKQGMFGGQSMALSDSWSSWHADTVDPPKHRSAGKECLIWYISILY